MNKQQWQLGRLIFDPQRRTLQRAGQQCTLEPKQAQLLLLLAEHAAEPVSREQLINEVWQGRVVSESAINRAVSLLRKACASLDPATDYIATIPKLGYCLLPDARLLSTVTVSETEENTAPLIPPHNADKPEQSTVKMTEARPTASRNSMVIWLSVVLAIAVVAASWAWLQSAPAATTQNKVLIPEPLTSFDGAEFDISSSIDGQLLYHRRDAEGKIQLWLRSEQQDKPLIATQVQVQALNGSISPDGKQVVYRRIDGNQCQIMLLSLDSASPERALFDCPTDSAFEASWSPDNEYFFYRLRQSKTRPYLVYRYQIATANLQQLTLADPASFNGAVALAIAADGQQLAVASYLTPARSRLSLYQLADGQPPQLQHTTDLDIAVVDLNWPAGQPLMLASNNQLFSLAADYSLKHYFYSQQPVNSITSTAQHLYFASQQQQADIWRQPLQDADTDTDTVQAADSDTGGNAVPLIYSSRLDILPRVNQQDTELLFLTTRQGLHQIWRKPHNGPEHMLAAIPAPAGFIRLSWSFDQRSVYFSQQGAVYQLELANGQLSQLFSAEHQAYVVNPGPDNNSLIYSSNKTGDWQLWRYQQQGDVHQQLTTHGGYSGYHQSNTLYYSKYHQDGLWQRDLDSTEEQLLLADFDKINWLNWQLQGESIIYYQPGAGIFRQLLGKQTEPELLLAYSPELVHHYSVSNRAIYFVKRQPPQGDIYQLPLP
ncbi:DNA-binding winged helix-turn-helix (wHTH) domain-containing protein [Arsukibacterium tuosuense]|uniref:DNA-binding winged helix-turn-helix (WHTH) domain-containing protein n=1 Tax=Arsukibacterium tuosuense TaxID=1323745 RepID=A0A285IMF5_9GAMM|nr:winged helix-turn-helix domain-containing protein [Arsukibacterium tuosuense]SNY49063.1 DNA-binding winged helix-turn-helix (wHTH) domain-containing protein [Arsukibacterium tuosuense]